MIRWPDMFQSNLNLVVQLKLSAILKLFFVIRVLVQTGGVNGIMLYINEVVGTYSYFVN